MLSPVGQVILTPGAYDDTDAKLTRMIIEQVADAGVKEESRLVLVTQTDHAALAADLLGLFPALANHELRAPLTRAVRQHDNGWQEVDAVPPLDSRGRPHGFLTLPIAQRVEIWRRAVRRLRDDPEAAALVACHALYVLRPSASGTKVDHLRAWLEEQISEFLGFIDWSRQRLTALHGWLRLVDAVSLHACGAWGGRTGQVAGVTSFASDGEEVGHDPGMIPLTVQRPNPQVVVLEPLPLVAPTRCKLRFRSIPDRHYSSESELASELASCRWESREILFTSGEEGE